MLAAGFFGLVFLFFHGQLPTRIWAVPSQRVVNF